MAGDVAAMFGGGSVAPLVQSGKLRGLAISGARRSPAAAGPAGHRRILSRIRSHDLAGPVRAGRNAAGDLGAAAGEANAVLAQPDFAEKLAAAGSGDPFVTTLPDFPARIRSNSARYGRLIKDTGLTVD